MSKEYQDLLETLLAIDSIKEEVMAIDSDPNLTEEEKYAKLASILCTEYMRRKLK